jgi:clan AA aspartic protease
MIVGRVNPHNEAFVEVLVRGPHGQATTVTAIVDTGFDGALILPPSLVTALQLPFRKRAPMVLGDGTEAAADVHLATVQWDDTARQEEVTVFESEALVGMRLLAGYRLTIQVIPGGQVLIESLAPSR